MTQHDELESLAVGVARADITPPVGIKSAGFAARGPLTGLHDPLSATALVVSDGTDKAALVACDLLGLDAETVGEIRREVCRRTGIPEQRLSIVCTHTHYGPDPYRDTAAPDVRAYRANLIFTAAGVVEEAASKLQPARLGVRWGESDIGINRREKRPDGQIILGNNPTGPIDRALGVLRVEGHDGRPIACVVNFQTHPVSQGGRTSHTSADYVGRMREIVEALTGAKSLFLQGAGANINPIRMESGYEPARTLGTRLGCKVVELWEMISPQPAEGLNVASMHLALPRIRYGSEGRAEELVRALKQEVERLRSEGAIDGLVKWAETRLSRAQEALESWRTGVPPQPVETELQAWCIAGLGIALVPGEIFAQIGQEVKARSPFRDTFFVGYANDSIGYVPVPEAYPEGGYEVERACQVDPAAAQMIVDSCVDLLHILEGNGR